jgi:hypothetical protein
MTDLVVVSVDPPLLEIKPGREATARLNIRNRSEQVEHYELRSEGVPEGWLEITPDQVSAFPAEETSAQVRVHPPAAAYGATYHITLTAISQVHSQAQGKALLELDVPVPVGVDQPQLSARPPIAEAPRPQTAAQIEVQVQSMADTFTSPAASQWQLRLANAGRVLDSFSFSTQGIRPEWLRIEPPEVTLNPGESGTAVLTVHPPDGTPAGIYKFMLRTFSHLNLHERTEIPLQVVVKPIAGFRLQITPQEAESEGRCKFQVRLNGDANSNVDLQIDLSAADQDDACDYIFQPPLVLLPSRNSAASILLVSPRTLLKPGARKTYTFRVVATSRDGNIPPQRVEARLTQIPPGPLTLTLRPQVQTADLEAEYAVVVANPTAVEAVLDLSASDPEEGCEYLFEPQRITIPPEAEGRSLLKIKAKSYFDEEGSKSHSFSVSATRARDLVPTVTATGQFIQRPRKVVLELLPPQQSSTAVARYLVRARNPRSASVTLSLQVADEADALLFALTPTVLTLHPQEEATANLAIEPKDRLLSGEQRRAHKFTVTAQVGGSEKTIAASGVLAQVSNAVADAERRRMDLAAQPSRAVAQPPPTAVANPPRAVAQPPTAVANPPTAMAQPPTATGGCAAPFLSVLRMGATLIGSAVLLLILCGACWIILRASGLAR